jgi:pyrroloquinoline quinone (PQQ) biosynthesis protein C
MTPFATLYESTAEERNALSSLPILEDLSRGNFDLASYQSFLINAYHHVRHTVPLMMACGARLTPRQSWLQPALVEYIREEAGHEQWILNDLGATGADPAPVAAGRPGFEAELLVSYVYDFVNRRNALGFFGMVHVLEGTSTALATTAADLIQQKLGLKDSAFSYLRSHGELDREHVQFFEQLIDQIGFGQDLDDVITVARHVYRLYGNVLESVPRSEQRHVA